MAIRYLKKASPPTDTIDAVTTETVSRILDNIRLEGE
jgi:hypothetical protein